MLGLARTGGIFQKSEGESPPGHRLRASAPAGSVALANARFFRSLSVLRRRAVIRGAALVVAMTAAAFIAWQYRPGAIRVVDGDTIRMGMATYRLVGFDTPEIGDHARCARELGRRGDRPAGRT